MAAVTNITTEYVDQRFRTFVEKYGLAMKTLGYDSDHIEDMCGRLSKRLTERDFKTYGDTPLHDLHAGKRITRFYLKQSIRMRPTEVRRREELRQRYNAKVAAAREENPHANFFSFETSYAKLLAEPMAPFKKMFYL